MKARLGNILFTSFSGLALIIGGVISYVVVEQWLRGRVFDETDVFRSPVPSPWLSWCGSSGALVGIC
jgi:hypothetical protein